jgi:(p)ppGpp synthase/HD superfamily hydrolase
MKYTLRIQAAIRFAIKTHDVYQKQKRKGKTIAYITHPMTVGLILSQARVSEDIIIAGILHDTIEDSIPEKKVTVTMLRERFGSRVAALVDSVTEHRKSDSWAKRKREALRHIGTFSHGSVLVKSADVIANVRESFDDYAREGEAVFRRFHAPKEQTLENIRNVINALLRRWPSSPLARDLRELRRGLNTIM